MSTANESRVYTKSEFCIGDKVTWKSQAGGWVKEKSGVIVAVVRAGDDPRKCVPAGGRIDGAGSPRSHRSYLVRVGASSQLYWPRSSQLRASIS